MIEASRVGLRLYLPVIGAMCTHYIEVLLPHAPVLPCQATGDYGTVFHSLEKASPTTAIYSMCSDDRK